jgi:adenine-specific DNA methylase
MKQEIKLTEYRVALKEEEADKFTLFFDCMAEDDEHAEEQAFNAYPDCIVLSVIESP